MNDFPDRRRDAIHEAGHAVVGRRLGLACGDVSIEKTDDGLGYAVIADPRFAWERGDGSRKAAAETFCVALYAGAEAERMIFGDAEVGDEVDCDRATACLAWAGVRGAQFVGDEVFDRREAVLRQRARLAVGAYRRSIERLADALLRDTTLNKTRADELATA